MKMNLFTKILLILTLLLIPIIFLFSYTTQVSIRVVEEQIKDNNINRISYFIGQMDNHFTQFGTSISSINTDQRVTKLIYLEDTKTPYDSYHTKLEIQDFLINQMTYINWQHNYSVWVPRAAESVSTYRFIDYNDYFMNQIQQGDTTFYKWEYDPGTKWISPAFVYRSIAPISAKQNIMSADLISEARVEISNIKDMLKEIKLSSAGDQFLYHAEHGVITYTSANNELMKEITTNLSTQLTGAKQGAFNTWVNNEKYMVIYTLSESLDWYLVEYVSVETILTPILDSQRVFWISILVLLLLGVFAAYLLYRHVQIPVTKLFRAVKQVQKGDFATKLETDARDEFGYLLTKFNLMTETMDHLINRVYVEELRSRDAELKQLQLQINPHFLYNSLFFIKNMARLGQHEAVMAMAVKLGEYFRYTTFVGKQETTVREEMKLINNYLSIQKMRMKRIHFEINIPSEMEDAIVPRLIVQPVVENAVIHGLEQRVQNGIITIQGYVKDDEYSIIVDDSGVGMSEEELSNLREKLSKVNMEEMGCGLNNVHQRLLLKYGEPSGVELFQSQLGGLRVVIRWRVGSQVHQEPHN